MCVCACVCVCMCVCVCVCVCVYVCVSVCVSVYGDRQTDRQRGQCQMHEFSDLIPRCCHLYGLPWLKDLPHDSQTHGKVAAELPS